MKPSFEQLKAACPEVDGRLIERHLARLGDRYFECFNLDEIARHLCGLATLSPQSPVAVWAERKPDGRIDCTFVAFDYPGEFSLFTGVLAGMGFNIESGDVFTYLRDTEASPAASRRFLSRRQSFGDRMPASALDRRCLVDRFTGAVAALEDFDAWAADVSQRVSEVIRLVEQRQGETARNQVNELVTRMLEVLQVSGTPVLYPVDLEVDNDSGPFTRIRVVSEDTPAFLYSLSNALFLRGFSIERVTIRTILNRVQDEIDFVDSQGAKILDPEILNQVKLSVLLTKQFTYFLPNAPDPYSALCRFRNLLEDILALPERGRWLDLFSQPRNLEGLARVLGASNFMWEDIIRLQHEALLPMLEPFVEGRRFFEPSTLARRLEAATAGAGTFEERRRRLNAFKDQEIFLIDLDHILGKEVGRPRQMAEHLTLLAEKVLNAALAIVFDHLAARHGRPRTVGGIEARLAMLGLGKLGGVALGYASDIELLFVYSDNGATDGAHSIRNSEFFENLVKEFIAFIEAKREGIFDLDLRLRPYGNKGPLACSLENFCRYFGPGGEAHSYERLALVRLRAIGGDRGLGGQIERVRDEFVYATQNIDIKAIRELREKQHEEKTGGRYNAKFSPGALVDLEYDVQILQVMYAKEIPALKTPRIHEALEALMNAGKLSPAEERRLVDSYYFLRRLINGLRMLRGNARDLFLPPVESDEFRHLARRMGYEKKQDLEPARQLSLDFETRTAAVRAFVERHFGRDSLPGPVMGNVADLVLSDNVPQDLKTRILSGAGFRDVERAFVNLNRLGGRGPRRDLFARLAVLACDTLKSKPDADMALNNWEQFASSLENPEQHFETLLSQPKRLDILLSIFAGSQFLADTLVHNVEFFDWVTSPENLHRSLRRDEVERDLRQMSQGLADRGAWLDAIRRYRRREILRIATRDICLGAALQDVTLDLSILAESLVQVVLERFWKDWVSAEEANVSGEELARRFCVLAFGKLGGNELNYSSDIDLLGVYDGPSSPAFTRAMERIREDLANHTAEGHAYRIDLRLRPYGRSGQLVQSLDSVERYYRSKSSLWERQALLKLRPIAGEREVGNRLLKRLQFVFEMRSPRESIAGSIERLRNGAIRKASLRNAAVIDVKDGAGGIRDVEFLVQGIQMMEASGNPDLLEGNTLKALDRLEHKGLIPSKTAGRLRDDYVFLRRVEHFLQILQDRQTHSLPSNEEDLSALAKRVLGPLGNADSFMDKLRTCQERVREAYETLLTNRR